MGYGLLQQGSNVKNQAMSGIKNAAMMEQDRKLANDGIDRQEKAAKVSNATAGATLGATLGASAASAGMASAAAAGTAATGLAGMGVMGAGLATGGIGLAAGLLLSELL